jgi:Domain of unknown function (DUF4389)
MSKHPVRLVVTDDLQRSRFTVGLRALFAIPHYIWLGLWTVLALLAGVLNWLATLLLGRSPSWLHHFLAAYVKYVTQFYAYLRIAANPYPSFDAPDGYPIDLQIDPPARQARLTVLARLLLAIPALVIAQSLGGTTSFGLRRSSLSSLSVGGLGSVVSVAAWFVGVAQRRTPRGLRDATAYSLGYGAQTWAYVLLLTDRYPDSDPLAVLPDVLAREDPVGVRARDDLRRSRLTILFRLPLSFPHLLWLALWSVLAFLVAVLNWLLTLFRGRSPERLHRFLSAYVRYAISVYAFLYVTANPFPGFVGAPGAYPAFETVIAPPARQNRWKVGFRLVLAIPALLMAGAYSAVVTVVGFFAWWSALIRGRLPRGLRNAGALSLRYQAQSLAYVLLLSDSYPYTGPLPGDGPDGA